MLYGVMPISENGNRQLVLCINIIGVITFSFDVKHIEGLLFKTQSLYITYCQGS